MLLAIIWLPVTSHCLLFESGENPGLLPCCNHAQNLATEDNHHENECATDSCSIIEGAQYKSSLQRQTVPPFVAQIIFELSPPLPLIPPQTLIGSTEIVSRLESLPGSWRFSTRTALPPRAPSFTS